MVPSASPNIEIRRIRRGSVPRRIRMTSSPPECPRKLGGESFHTRGSRSSVNSLKASSRFSLSQWNVGLKFRFHRRHP